MDVEQLITDRYGKEFKKKAKGIVSRLIEADFASVMKNLARTNPPSGLYMLAPIKGNRGRKVYTAATCEQAMEIIRKAAHDELLPGVEAQLVQEAVDKFDSMIGG